MSRHSHSRRDNRLTPFLEAQQLYSWLLIHSTRTNLSIFRILSPYNNFSKRSPSPGSRDFNDRPVPYGTLSPLRQAI